MHLGSFLYVLFLYRETVQCLHEKNKGSVKDPSLYFYMKRIKIILGIKKALIIAGIEIYNLIIGFLT